MTAEIFNLDPKATTSAEYQETNKAKRDHIGSYFGDRVKRIEGKAAPDEAPVFPTKPIKLQPYPTKLSVADLGPLNEQRK